MAEQKRKVTSGSKLVKLKNEYIDWLLLTPEQRTAFGMPASIGEFSRMRDIGERTLRRWNGLPEFQAEVEQRREAVARAAALSTGDGAVMPAAVPGPRFETLSLPEVLAQRPVDGIDGAFEFAWAKLQSMIAEGDKSALQLFMNSPLAKAVMEAQLEQKKSDFSDLSDELLISKLTSSLLDDELIAAVEARGFSVVRE